MKFASHRTGLSDVAGSHCCTTTPAASEYQMAHPNH